MPPEALQEHFNMSPDNIGQASNSVVRADSLTFVESDFADIIQANYGVEAADEVRTSPTPIEMAESVGFVRPVGSNLRQIRISVGGFDTPGTDALPDGFERAYGRVA